MIYHSLHLSAKYYYNTQRTKNQVQFVNISGVGKVHTFVVIFHNSHTI